MCSVAVCINNQSRTTYISRCTSCVSAASTSRLFPEYKSHSEEHTHQHITTKIRTIMSGFAKLTPAFTAKVRASQQMPPDHNPLHHTHKPRPSVPTEPLTNISPPRSQSTHPTRWASSLAATT